MTSPDSRPAAREPGSVADILEPGQLTENRCTPVPRAQLGRRAQAALWVLRISVLVLVFMVGYTFVIEIWP
jgi:hypothetical protein